MSLSNIEYHGLRHTLHHWLLSCKAKFHLRPACAAVPVPSWGISNSSFPPLLHPSSLWPRSCCKEKFHSDLQSSTDAPQGTDVTANPLMAQTLWEDSPSLARDPEQGQAIHYPFNEWDCASEPRLGNEEATQEPLVAGRRLEIFFFGCCFGLFVCFLHRATPISLHYDSIWDSVFWRGVLKDHVYSSIHISALIIQRGMATMTVLVNWCRTDPISQSMSHPGIASLIIQKDRISHDPWDTMGSLQVLLVATL